MSFFKFTNKHISNYNKFKHNILTLIVNRDFQYMQLLILNL